MKTNWIVEIMSVMFLIPTQEFGGTVMMTISLIVVIYHKGFILDRVKKKNKKSDVRLNICIICGLYQNKQYEKIQLYFFARMNQRVQNQSYKENN